MRTAHAFAALSQSGDSYELRGTNGDVCLQIGLSDKHSYWLKFTTETPKNATRTSAIYRFYFTKFMREMLRSLSKKVITIY